MSIPAGMEKPRPRAKAKGTGERAGKDARLSKRAWQRAALEALIADGIAGLTVPRLAATLGVTKGSFYWHFESVADLLRAALEDWERIFTDERLAAFASEPDPRRRLAPWIAESGSTHPAQRLHLAIASAADDPVIAPVFARVTEKRVAFLRAALVEIGLPKADAESRAVAAYAAYLGFLRLAESAPKVAGNAHERAGRAQQIFALIAPSNSASTQDGASAISVKVKTRRRGGVAGSWKRRRKAEN